MSPETPTTNQQCRLVVHRAIPFRFSSPSPFIQRHLDCYAMALSSDDNNNSLTTGKLQYNSVFRRSKIIQLIFLFFVYPSVDGMASGLDCLQQRTVGLLKNHKFNSLRG